MRRSASLLDHLLMEGLCYLLQLRKYELQLDLERSQAILHGLEETEG